MRCTRRNPCPSQSDAAGHERPILVFAGQRANLWEATTCAAQLAARHVDAKNDSIVRALGQIHPSFRLRLETSDTAGNEAGGLRAFLTSDVEHIDGYVGAVRSDVSELVAQLTGLESVLQISPASSSPVLSDKATFPFFARTYPSDLLSAQLLGETLLSFNWRYVTLVYVRDSFGSGYQQALAAAAGPLGLHIHLDGVASDGAGGADVDDLRIVVAEVKSHRENIMIVAMLDYGPFLDTVLELDMLSSDYAYVLIEGASQAAGLGTRQRQQLSGMLSWAVSGPVSSAQTAATARLSDVWSTLTPADCANEVFVPNTTMFAQAPPDVAAFTFDAVAALALAISHAEYGDASGGVAQAGGTATERQRRRLAELLNVSFDGTSGLVRFDRSGDRLAADLGFELCNFVIGLDTDVSCRAARIVDGAGVRHVRDIVWLQNSSFLPKPTHTFAVLMPITGSLGAFHAA